jgi:hypothetical protein
MHITRDAVFEEWATWDWSFKHKVDFFLVVRVDDE